MHVRSVRIKLRTKFSGEKLIQSEHGRRKANVTT